VLGGWLGSLAAGAWWQGQALDRWERLTSGLEPARPIVPPPPQLTRPVGGVDFRLRVPRLHYVAVVREGVTPQVLFTGPGHYPGTAWPGEDGNVGIAAHNVYWLRFDELRPGDAIYLDTRYGTFRYRVTRLLVVPPDAGWVLDDAPGRLLTLTTCSPLWAGQFAAGRLVIFATAAPGPTGERPGSPRPRPPAPIPAGLPPPPGSRPGLAAPHPAGVQSPPGAAPPGTVTAAGPPSPLARGTEDRKRLPPREAFPRPHPRPGHDAGQRPPGRVHHPPPPRRPDGDPRPGRDGGRHPPRP